MRSDTPDSVSFLRAYRISFDKSRVMPYLGIDIVLLPPFSPARICHLKPCLFWMVFLRFVRSFVRDATLAVSSKLPVTEPVKESVVLAKEEAATIFSAIDLFTPADE